jgi:hypothetical protein
MKYTTLLALCLLLSLPAFAQERDWKADNLKGRVQSVRSEYPEPTGNESSRLNKPDVTITLYDTDGRKIRQTNFQSPDSVVSEEVFSFNKAGELIEQKMSAGRASHSITFEYNDKGQLTSETMREADGAVSLITTYQYDESGKKKLRILTNAKYPDSKDVLTYDGRERFFEQISTRGGRTTYHRRFEYDYYPSGRLRREATTELLAGPVMAQINVYDENGNRTEFIRCGPDSKPELREVFKYDDKGNEIEIAYYNGRGERTAIIKRIYEYDRQGNWVKEQTEQTRPGESIKYVRTRTITYY